MNAELDQLVAEVAEATGAANPAWLEDDAPVLEEAEAQDSFYLVGIIGGKDVGKSALVNALVGREITLRTSYGPGTQTVIAYAHASQRKALQELLEREVAGRYAIIEHDLPHLTRQVLLDLPDIDSHWGDHLAITRKMLRHMLFPVWMQSIEKYADRQPQELLARVAAGNAPGNFVFCLNKVDQLQRSGVGGQRSEEGDELRQDYASRLQRVLQLDHTPRIWAISALHPDRYDLPALRETLARQKSDEAVRESRRKAALRQKASVLAWLTDQNLPDRAARLARLQDEAEEFVNERLGEPILESLLPRLTDDPLYRQSILDDCLSKRVSRWPIVNVLHPIFAAIAGFFRRNAEPAPRPLTTPTGEALVDQQLRTLAPDRTLGEMIQRSFALLQQSQPAASVLYKDRKLWESLPASTAAAKLRDMMIATVDHQRAAACARLDRDGPWSLLRGLLTIGALLWFPFIQPLAETWLANRVAASQPAMQQQGLPLLFVRLLSLNNLIGTLTSLLIYFAVLWLILRWDTRRRVDRQFARWKRLEGLDPSLSLTAKTLEWLAGLVKPIREAREKMEGLAGRVEELRSSSGAEST
jgi:hypothetical protein